MVKHLTATVCCQSCLEETLLSRRKEANPFWNPFSLLTTTALPNIIDLINVQVFTCEMNIVVVGHFDTMLHFERPNISTFNGAWDMQHRNWFSF